MGEGWDGGVIQIKISYIELTLESWATEKDNNYLKWY